MRVRSFLYALERHDRIYALARCDRKDSFEVVIFIHRICIYSYLRNLEKCLSFYQAGLYYWQEAKLWCEKANTADFKFLFITAKQAWEDERERISTGKLDYEKILNREIKRVEKNIEQLNQMSEKY